MLESMLSQAEKYVSPVRHRISIIVSRLFPETLRTHKLPYNYNLTLAFGSMYMCSVAKHTGLMTY